MGTELTDVLQRHAVPRHRLTRADYHRLGAAGILGEDDRVELLDGQLVDMSPIGPRHALVVDALGQLLVTAVAGRAWVRVQNPIALDPRSEPQPDIAVIRRPWQGYPVSHPQPQDVFLVIEVSDTSVEIDRGAKLELYARAGVQEVWIVDLTEDAVFVHRKPRGGSYEFVSRLAPPDVLDIEALPDVTVPSASLFPPGLFQTAV